MNRNWIKNNITTSSIIVFFVLYLVIIICKSSLIYNKDGSLRDFGVGQSRKTITPIWLVSILIAIVSYMAVLFYLTYPKFSF